MKRTVFFVIASFAAYMLSSCTPLLVGGAAAGSVYIVYKLHEEGCRVNITKDVEGKRDAKTDKKE